MTSYYLVLPADVGLAVLLVGPVLFALGLATLVLFGGHDDDPAVLLPHHLPEVALRVGQAPLRRDVRLARRQQ